MSVKSWNPSATVSDARQENPDPPSHILLKEVVLDAGSATPQVIASVLLYTGVAVLSAFALVMSKAVLWGIGCATPCTYITISLVTLALYTCLVGAIHKWRTAEFVVEGGVIEGVDLWNVERVRYTRHTVWLDKVRIDGIPNTKVFLQSLEDYYLQLTGVELP